MSNELYTPSTNSEQNYRNLRDDDGQSIQKTPTEKPLITFQEYMRLQREYLLSEEHKIATIKALDQKPDYNPSIEELSDHYINSNLAEQFSIDHPYERPLAKAS